LLFNVFVWKYRAWHFQVCLISCSLIFFFASLVGVWFMHCHLEVHTTWGLKMAFLVDNGKGPKESLLPPPSDLPKCWNQIKNYTNSRDRSHTLSGNLVPVGTFYARREQSVYIYNLRVKDPICFLSELEDLLKRVCIKFCER
jgi:hypothetical protein